MSTALIIGGPTATGKTDLAVELALQYGAALLSADAMTVYRGMDVGTAKPARALLDRLPHAAIDEREPDEDWSVADFVDAFHRVSATSARVVVVGGTPFYLRALARPLASLPGADPTLRAELEALPDPHARLREVDPPSAERLHPNDRVRVVRALEVSALSGMPMSALHARDAARPALVPEAHVGWLDRDDLRSRIDARVAGMVEQGYLDEVRRLLDLWPREIKPLRSFAYTHLVDHLLLELPLDEALRRTARDTWVLARKQRTWARGMGWAPTDPAGIRALARRVFEGPGAAGADGG